MAKQTSKTSAETAVPETRQFNGRTFKRRQRAKLDGFLFCGSKDAPLKGTIVAEIVGVHEGKPTKANPDKPNRFLILDVHTVEGALLLADQDEPEPYAPEAWTGLKLGLNMYASLEGLAAPHFGGQTVLIDIGGNAKNPASGRTYRAIEYYLPEGDE